MSLLGWREKRYIEDLEDRLEQHRRSITKLEEAKRDLTALAEGRQAVIRQQAGELTQYKREAADLGRILTRETVEAVEDVAAAQAVAARYRLAWTSARQRAADYAEGILRHVKDRDTYKEWLRQEQEATATLRASGDAELRRRLARSEEARASLQAQLEMLQKVNEALNAEGAAVADRAWRKARHLGEVST